MVRLSPPGSNNVNGEPSCRNSDSCPLMLSLAVVQQRENITPNGTVCICCSGENNVATFCLLTSTLALNWGEKQFPEQRLLRTLSLKAGTSRMTSGSFTSDLILSYTLVSVTSAHTRCHFCSHQCHCSHQVCHCPHLRHFNASPPRRSWRPISHVPVKRMLKPHIL